MSKKNVYFLIIVLLFIISYFCLTKKEKMTNLYESESYNNKEKIKTLLNLTKEYINEKINEVYRADIESIRTLATISTKLQTEGLTVPGNLNVQGSFNYLPTGTIVAFNNSEAPNGWALCDGTKGTPDLRGRFIYGHGSGKNFGENGGDKTHTLIIDEIPNHNHDRRSRQLVNNGKNTDKSGNDSKVLRDNKTHNNLDIKNNKTHSNFISNQSQNQPDNNMPPYYVLSYIMKL